MNILFIDRDGTLIEEPLDYQVDSLNKIRLKKAVIPALLSLKEAGFYLAMVTNQDGLGTKAFPRQNFESCQQFILELLASQGIIFDAIFICPHFAEEQCACRKPKLGLIEAFLQQNSINKEQSWVIGDRESDETFAQNLNIGFCKITTDTSWLTISKTILTQLRSISLERKTKETCINLSITLDSTKENSINTPIPFFSHMLDQIAKHAGFYLALDAKGDIEVDDHHLIEDTALILGQALNTILADKQGFGRYGFALPMDEALALVALDISGRSFCRFKARFTREYVGNMATEMVAHFFKSFAYGLKASLHLQCRGKNNHHLIEACFKGLGRALRQALAKNAEGIPSTKGIL